MTELNSRDYWDHRFGSDWSARGGGEQSEFFAAVALANLPAWFLTRVEREHLSFCDWGCAQGQGTAWLAARLPGTQWTGVDFSTVAIETAAAAHPGVRFLCRDYTTSPVSEQFDVVFSSNTLEHFAAPWPVLAQLMERARRYLVLMVPFRETPERREPEHASTFEFGDLRLMPMAGWSLVHAAIVHTATLSESRWPGDQALLIWASQDEVARLELSLADLRLDTREATDLRDRLLAEGAELHAKLDDSSAALARLESDLHAATARRRELEAVNDRLAATVGDQRAELAASAERARAAITEHERRHAELQARLTAIEQSLSWRWTAPIRGLLGALRGRSGAG